MRKAIVYCHDTEAGLLEESTPGRGYTFTYDKQYMMDRTHDPVSLTGENGAFPPTRDGCIHSLSMRERG